MTKIHCFLAAVIASTLSGCMVLVPFPPPLPPPPPFAQQAAFGLPALLREACVGQFEGARMPLPGRHRDAVPTGRCERAPDGQLTLLPELPSAPADMMRRHDPYRPDPRTCAVGCPDQ